MVRVRKGFLVSWILGLGLAIGLINYITLIGNVITNTQPIYNMIVALIRRITIFSIVL